MITKEPSGCPVSGFVRPVKFPTVNAMNGKPYILPTNPVQFDGHHVQPTGAPEHGQHTEEILLEAGVDWDKIEQYKQDGSIL